MPQLPCLDLFRQQLAEKLHRHISIGQAADFGQELVRENRDVGFLQTR